MPDRLHPAAWWVWALALGTAASRTTNPWLLLLAVAVAGYVVAARRSDEPWAGSYLVFLKFGLAAVGFRLVMHALLGGVEGETVLFSLPEVPLPGWAKGIRLGGPVTAEGVVASLYDGMRLAALLACLGAANALANPKRLLRSMPAALYEVSVAVTVGLTVAPQLVASVKRVWRARELRGDTKRRARTVLVPVLTDALDRSLALAAAMDSRGYGRRGPGSKLAGGLVLAGLLGACFGLYGLLDGTGPAAAGAVVLVLGFGLATAGLVVGGRRVGRTTYRPDRWRAPEFLTVASGLVPAVVMAVFPDGLSPAFAPLALPALPVLPAAGLLVALLPGFVAPAPSRGTK
ncbi:CbiQ family ECF transporter T component [Longispora albida]|uniref:CbiQ family ECF transporter T component n=1 Tax=Longispora albida TaxID=203523 RepID=UPI00035F01FC|nr:CbiQ family ECF transporter T component [Longispora albida]